MVSESDVYHMLEHQCNGNKDLLLQSYKSDYEFLLAVARCKHLLAAYEYVLAYADDALTCNRDFVLSVVSLRGRELKLASDRFRYDEHIILAALMQDGDALEHAPDSFRGRKDIALQALEQTPSAIRFIRPPLHRSDPELLAAAYPVAHADVLGVVLSVRYGWAAKASPITTALTKSLREQYELKGKIRVYDPNVISKGFCGPTWIKWMPSLVSRRFFADDEEPITSRKWPCRGQCRRVCTLPCRYRRRGCNCLCGVLTSLMLDQVPTDESCWRFSFRWHLERARRAHGCMVQVVEQNGDGTFELGKGQEIETQMATDVGIKTYRVQIPNERYVHCAAQWLATQISTDTESTLLASDLMVMLLMQHWRDLTTVDADAHTDGTATKTIISNSIITCLEDLELVTQVSGCAHLAHVLGLLASPEEEIRSAALFTVPVFSMKGDRRVLSILNTYLSDPSSRVRQFALQAIVLVSTCNLHFERTSERGRGTVGFDGPRGRTVSFRMSRSAVSSGTYAGNLEVICSALACLEDNSDIVRDTACKFLSLVVDKGNGTLVEKGDGLLKSKLSSLLKHPKPNIRETAMKAMSMVVETGEVWATSAAIAYLANQYELQPEYVWAFDQPPLLFDCLLLITGQGNRQAIVELVSLLGHQKGSVRGLGVHGLSVLVKRGDACALSAVTMCLSSPEWHTREAAVNAIGKLAVLSDQQAVDNLVASLEDSSTNVREAAVAAFETLDVRGVSADFHVLSLATRVADSNPWVARAALHVLVAVVKEGDVSAIEALSPCLKHADSEVRKKALGALRKIATKGQDKGIDLAMACLHDIALDVRREAFQILRTLAAKDDDRVISAVSAVLGQSAREDDSTMQEMAVNALAGFAEKADACALACSALADKSLNENVRLAALQALCKLARRGDGDVVATMASCLNDGKGSIRRQMVKAIANVAEADDEQVLAAVITCLRDDVSGVRLATVEVLPKIVANAKEKVADALRKCLRDSDDYVRAASVEAIAMLTPTKDMRAIIMMEGLLNDSNWAVRQAASIAVADSKKCC